ncbi:anti-toxin [Devosia insulae DS-56]|uniref:Anti-toxin n=1 Tax=Devosia insulae DS-56 TaxID=1116389 RepID=A0A1E5XPC8_9HYPH|nr:DUF6290 family protein [Devosia insulae]OEO30460.1 anti-toxin [Devosia insulae DS-56]
MLAIRLPKDIEDRLEALAKKTGRTKTFYAREAILEKIEDMEDYYLAEERILTPAKRISWDELKAEMDKDTGEEAA